MKDLIPYIEALELNNLGFSEFCFMQYWINNEGLANTKWYWNHNRGMKLSAPLFSQAFRFFRENYGLYISFVRYRNSVVIEMPDTFSKVYEIWIQDENKDESIWVGCFDGQEEAELECLKKLIQIVKQ